MNHWMLLCLVTWALWALQLLALRLVVMPYLARAHRELGYKQGRYDAERGYPRRQVTK